MLFSLLGMFLIQDGLDSAARAAHYNHKKGLAIQGYDPVAYFDGAAKKGSSAFSFEYQGLTYRFVDQADLDRFKANPSQFEPQFGGWCAYAMLEGDKVEIDPKKFKVIEGKLYLFYNGLWGDTLKKWNEMAQSDPESKLVATANAKWAGLIQ